MTPLYMRDLFMKGRGESSLSAKSGELLLPNSTFPPQTGEMVGTGGLRANSSQGEQRHCSWVSLGTARRAMHKRKTQRAWGAQVGVGLSKRGRRGKKTLRVRPLHHH